MQKIVTEPKVHKYAKNNRKLYTTAVMHTQMTQCFIISTEAISARKASKIWSHTVYFGLHKVFLSIFNIVMQLCKHSIMCSNINDSY